MRQPVITGNTMIEKGDSLNLTCSMESFPPPRITWSKHGSNTNLHHESKTDLENHESATLVIHSATLEHSGQYICTAEHLDTTVTTFADVSVICE